MSKALGRVYAPTYDSIFTVPAHCGFRFKSVDEPALGVPSDDLRRTHVRAKAQGGASRTSNSPKGADAENTPKVGREEAPPAEGRNRGHG